MSIIIFSKNYTYSRWCLDELAEILKFKRTKGHAVLPIFYDVDPSDVRHQTGSFAEAFKIHEIQFVDEIDKVDRWKAALTEVANLSGYHLENDANGRISLDFMAMMFTFQARTFKIGSAIKEQDLQSLFSCHCTRKKKSLGMAFWVIYGDETYSLIQVVVVNKTDGTEFEFTGSIWTTGVHSWVCYIPKPFSIRNADRIEVYFRGIMNEDVKVEMCGVHLVYKPDMSKIAHKREREINATEKSCHSKRSRISEENWNSIM